MNNQESDDLHMNINNFQNNINKTILDRGYDYYIEGNIIETYNQEDSKYIFIVQGSEEYEVVVKLDKNGEIVYSDCDCPYDFGPICKHQVAAFCKLYEIFNSEDNSISTKKQVAKQSEIKEVLNNLSKEQLISIIEAITKKDKTLKNSLIVRYSKGDNKQEIEKCKKLIGSIVSKYAGRDDYIMYRETCDYVSEMEDLLDKVRDTEDILLALDIAFLVLNEAIEAFQYADDSDGDIGGLVSETIELISDIIYDSEDLDKNIREEVFYKLMEQSDSKSFDGWEEYRIDMLGLCTKFVDIEELRNKLVMKIQYSVNKNLKNENMKYSNESMLHLLYEIIDEYGTKEQAEQFIKDNLNFASFRELLINKYIKEENYHKVIELTLEGEKQDKEFAGLISKWKKIRYTAYKELSLKEEQEKLAKELFLHGDFEYYSQLKELNTGDKEDFYNSLKQELKKDKNWSRRDIYLELIVAENDLDEIMEVVRENPRNIEDYADMLADKFRDEVIDIYKKHIKLSACASSDRRRYQEVCGILKRYKKIAGRKSQEELINELSDLYRKRPAFVDELSKIK